MTEIDERIQAWQGFRLALEDAAHWAARLEAIDDAYRYAERIDSMHQDARWWELHLLELRSKETPCWAIKVTHD